MEGDKQFTQEHGRLTYHELTMKGRHLDDKGPFPKMVDELKVNPEVKTPEVKTRWSVVKTLLSGKRKSPHEIVKTEWAVIQTNESPEEVPVRYESGMMELPLGAKGFVMREPASPVFVMPEQPTIWEIDPRCHNPSEHGIYDGRYFGLGLEERSVLKIGKSATRIDFADYELMLKNYSPQNTIFFAHNIGQRLYHTPEMKTVQDYLALMGIHIDVLSGKNTKVGNVSKFPLKERIDGFELSGLHLKGFRDAAESCGDSVSKEKTSGLIRYIDDMLLSGDLVNPNHI